MRIKRNIEENRIVFTTDASSSIKKSDLIFIAVGTPDKGDGSTDLKYVFNVAKVIGENLNGYKVIVDKSTVPIGTADMVKKIILENIKEKYSAKFIEKHWESTMNFEEVFEIAYQESKKVIETEKLKSRILEYVGLE